MKLNTYRRLQQDDYPRTYKDLLNGMFSVLNSILEQIYQALSNRLTYSDNFDCVYTTISVKAPVNNLKVKNTAGGTMAACQVLNVVPQNNQELLTSAPFVQFVNGSDGQLVLRTVTGLVDGQTYSLTLLFTR